MNNLYINGEWTDSHDHQKWQLINPATEQLIQEISYGNTIDAQNAIAAADVAFQTWRKTSPFQRAAYLKTAADYLRTHIEKIALDTVYECGKPLVEARGEWMVAANLFEWFAEEGKRAYGRTIPSSRLDKRMSTIYQPIGVVGVITAWNFPAYNPARAVAAALAAGCTVVCKPSEYTPISGIHLAKALEFAKIPNGVFNLLIADAKSVGDEFLKNPKVRKISFTGSTRVGKLLMDGASKTHTKLSLELGGNAPVLVFPDADIEALAKASSIAKFRNNGQVCVAAQRFIVHESVAKQFAKKVAQYVSELKVGYGWEASTQVGPMINKTQQQSVLEKLAQAKKQGAKIVTGGKPPKAFEKGYFVEPSVVSQVGEDNILFNAEIFGPVLPIIPFQTQEEAIRIANNTEYGLAAYIFTQKLNTAIHVSEALEFGMIGVNDWAPQATEAPFGGWKQSGQGHESGSEGLYEYLEKKLISIAGL
jgi:acyl-CoA reductase-like NAD-dependent aldehyde dehydrogenase